MEKPDRIPLFYQHLGGATRVAQSCGKTIHDGMHDPAVFAEITLAAHKMFGFDNVMAGWGDLLVEAQALGTKWKFPEGDFYPRVDAYAIQTPADFDKIQPVDPMKDPFWSVPLKAATILKEKVGDDVAIVGNICSPTEVAGQLMGLDKLVMYMMKKPDDVDNVMFAVVDSLNMYADCIKEIGLESIFIEDASAGADLMSPALCKQFDINYLKQVLDHCRSLGLKTIVHNCAAKPYLDQQAALKPDAIHFYNTQVDLDKVFSSYRGKMCIISGVDHAELLFRHTPDEVASEVKRVIDLFGKNPGFMLAPGCEMPFKVPQENVDRFKETVESQGVY